MPWQICILVTWAFLSSWSSRQSQPRRGQMWRGGQAPKRRRTCCSCRFTLCLPAMLRSSPSTSCPASRCCQRRRSCRSRWGAGGEWDRLLAQKAREAEPVPGKFAPSVLLHRRRRRRLAVPTPTCTLPMPAKHAHTALKCWLCIHPALLLSCILQHADHARPPDEHDHAALCLCSLSRWSMRAWCPYWQPQPRASWSSSCGGGCRGEQPQWALLLGPAC